MKDPPEKPTEYIKKTGEMQVTSVVDQCDALITKLFEPTGIEA